jgi:hypothetical protein
VFRGAQISVLAFIAFGCGISIAVADDRGTCAATPPKPDTFAACSRVIAAPDT